MARQLRVFNALVAAGAPPDKAAAVAATLFAPQLAAVLTESSPDMTPAEVGAFRRESPSTVQRKMRLGVYVSYRSGDKRLITRESVEADRNACLAAGPSFGLHTKGAPKIGSAAAPLKPTQLDAAEETSDCGRGRTAGRSPLGKKSRRWGPIAARPRKRDRSRYQRRTRCLTPNPHKVKAVGL
jgi:hypothetical protein